MGKEQKSPLGNKNLESDETTDIQREIEKKVEKDKQLEGEILSGELSKDRTHMSEHRTRMSEHRTDLSEHRTDLSYERTDLSLERTMLSYERTLMSWIRTSMSLITFGFTIYKAFEEAVGSHPSERILTPRIVGMIMICMGLLALFLAEIQHRNALKKLKKLYPDIEKSLSSVLSILILIFGLVLFFGALLRQ
jgi:putative membrane protein